MKIGGKFPDVVPEASQVTPLCKDLTVGVRVGEHVGSKFGRPVCDFIEVTVMGFQIFTVCAGFGTFTGTFKCRVFRELMMRRVVTPRREEVFPRCAILSCVRVELGWHGELKTVVFTLVVNVRVRKAGI